MTDAQCRFARRAVRRKNVFLALSIAGVVVALLLTAFYASRRWSDPTYPLGARAFVVVLVLLNARHGLRQYRHAGVLESIPDSVFDTRPAGEE